MTKYGRALTDQICLPNDWRVQLEFKIEDCWVGVFWKTTPYKREVWVCLVPCFPIHLTRLRTY